MRQTQAVRAIAAKDYREVTRRKAAFVYPVSLVIFWTLATWLIIRVSPAAGSPATYRTATDAMMTHYLMGLFLLSLFPLLPMVVSRERLTGTLEPLLASPASPRIIWIGKSLFLFLWSYACLLAFCASAAVVLFSQPSAQPAASLLSARTAGFIALSPITCGSITLLVAELALLLSPRLVSLVGAISLIAYLLAVSRLPAGASAGSVVVSVLAVSLAVVAVCAALSLALTRERLLRAGT
jgi:ABC-type transport system involved in multi-copper enzyme maturation permease subunit